MPVFYALRNDIGYKSDALAGMQFAMRHDPPRHFDPELVGKTGTISRNVSKMCSGTTPMPRPRRISATIVTPFIRDGNDALGFDDEHLLDLSLASVLDELEAVLLDEDLASMVEAVQWQRGRPGHRRRRASDRQVLQPPIAYRGASGPARGLAQHASAQCAGHRQFNAILARPHRCIASVESHTVQPETVFQIR